MRTVKHASLILCGDAILHESVYMDAKKPDGSFDFDRQLHHVRNLIQSYDLKYYNQETILGGRELGLSGYPAFNSPAEFGEYMIETGFNLISTATNHCLDMGTPGIRNAVSLFQRYPQVVMGGICAEPEERKRIPSITVNGIRIAFLSWCEQLNGNVPEEPWMVNLFTGHEEEMLEQIRQAKAENDAVILAIHWGEEYAATPNETQRSLAKACAEAGADLIIGNHVHVIQPFERIGTTPVFYAMGNLISSQLNQENLIGMIAGLDLELEEADGNKKLRIGNIRAEFVYTVMKGTYPDLRTDIEVIPFPLLNDSILPDYRKIHCAYAAYVRSMDDSITIGGV